MKFCSNCGSAQIRLTIPEGDDRPRYACPDCGQIFYENPKIITGCIVEWDQKILLCKRAIAPQYGFWTLPAGFMEQGENINQAAARETLEEAEAEVTLDGLYTIFSLPHISQVYLFFRASLSNGQFGAGIESIESKLFSEDEIPWEQLAFSTVKRALTLYFADRQKGNTYPLHIEDIIT